jgi:hypothetical protein
MLGNLSSFDLDKASEERANVSTRVTIIVGENVLTDFILKLLK